MDADPWTSEAATPRIATRRCRRQFGDPPAARRASGCRCACASLGGHAPAHRLTGKRVGIEMTVANDKDAVDEQVLNPLTRLVGPLVGRAIAHRRRIENRDVGVHSRLETSLLLHLRSRLF